MKSIKVNVTVELWDQIDVNAGLNGESKSDLIRRAIRNQLSVDEYHRGLGIKPVMDDGYKTIYVREK